MSMITGKTTMAGWDYGHPMPISAFKWLGVIHSVSLGVRGVKTSLKNRGVETTMKRRKIEVEIE